MKRDIHSHWAVVACGVLLAGCASAGAPVQPVQPVEPVVPDTPADPAGPGDAPMSAAGLQAAVEAAFADAATRTGLTRTSLRLASAEVVTWKDGSLGCPSPGGMYTQALVPGYRIVVDTGTTTLDYHVNARGRLLLCPEGRAVEPIHGEAM